MLVVSVCHSQTLQKGWNTFDGFVGENEVVLNVFLDSIGNLDGNYCYKKLEARILLKGKLTGTTFFLDEFLNGKINGKFYGKIEEKTDVIEGKWASNTHSDKFFSLKLSSSTGNSFENKYSTFVHREDVELFFKNTKKAILTDDKIWLSKNTRFPLNLYESGKVKLKIKNSKDFLKNYNLIITKSLQKIIKESCVCDIFSNSHGSMIANGAIWVNELDNHRLKITSINN